MRPAGRGELESLYFDYPHYQSSPAPELNNPSDPHPVVIVGAGPIGLTAALSLAAQGIRSVVLEARNTVNDGSRAVCIARPSMQIFDQLGLVEPFAKKALPWTKGRCYYAGEDIYSFEMPHQADDKFAPMVNLQQQYTELYLIEAAQKSGLIDLRWGARVTDLAVSSGGATLQVSSEHGAYSLEARYLLAADGARSAIRQSLGLRLAGQNYPGRYVIADIRADIDRPTERVALFEPKADVGATVLLHRQPNNIWRIDRQIRPGETEAEALEEENIRATVSAILTEFGYKGEWDLEWWSIYSANTLCLDEYRHGPVFFIGDSAHIVPIFGVRGLNNGIADSHNLSWKLAYVLRGLANDSLLDTYTPERRGATLDVFENAIKSTRFMTPPSRGWWLARQAMLSLAVDQDFAKPFANPRQMQPHTYADSLPAFASEHEAAFEAGPPFGAMALNTPLRQDEHLLDGLGNGFTAIWFGKRSDIETAKSLIQAGRSIDPEFELIAVFIDSTHAALSIDGLRCIHAAQGRLAKDYDAQANTCYLLRPDIHIGGRWRIASAEKLRAMLSHLLTGAHHE